ncbi:MAG: hypothetical protein WC119_02340 [Synergistaceae bacterium]
MSNNDVMIKELLAKVDEQTKALGNKPRSVLVTNGVFKRNSQDFFNINTVSDVSVLAEALAFLMTREDYFSKACKALGIGSIKSKWEGYTLKEWQEDFQLRKDIIEYNARKSKLDATKAKLKGLMSEDARTASELESIKEILGE